MGDGDWTEILVARCLRGFRCGDFASRHLCLLRFRVIGYLRLLGGWLVEAQSRIRHTELSDYFGGISMTFAETESPTLVESAAWDVPQQMRKAKERIITFFFIVFFIY